LNKFAEILLPDACQTFAAQVKSLEFLHGDPMMNGPAGDAQLSADFVDRVHAFHLSTSLPVWAYLSISYPNPPVKAFLWDSFSCRIRDMPSQEYLTKQEAVEYTRLSIATVDRLMKTKELKFGKVGRKVFFRKKDVDAFMAKRLVK
jgi:excisionase family DNA binding protein